jgi:pimeloyl-ACP methyl ester carboxylesterase
MTRTALQATSAFYESGTSIRLFRLVLSAFERVWPPLAVRAACRLFLTPLPPKWLNRRKSWDASWRVERWPFENASLTLYTRAAPSGAPVVLLTHGWGGHAGQMVALADAVTAQGFQPVLMDMPGHGRSAGAESTLPQFTRAIDYVAARLVEQGHSLRALVAHSLGASAAAFAASRGLPVDRLVLLAPPASPPEYTRLFARVFGLSETTRAAMQKRIEAREGLLMRQFEPASAGHRIRIPTLIVHDRGDSINRFADGQAYAHEIDGARLVATQGLGHRKILKDDQALREVASFLA